MKRRFMIAAAVCCAIGAMSLAACVPSQESASTTDASQAKESLIQVAPDTNSGVTMSELYAYLDEQAEEWAPEVVTMPNGVQVQRTPDSGGSNLYGGAASSYNTLYLNGDNRGCISCHTDGLADLVDNHLSFPHWPISNNLGTIIDVKDCISCHSDMEYVIPVDSFGSMIHGIHSRESFKGDCMSCHTATSGGEEMQLWEEAKYSVLSGISAVEDVQGEFFFDQTTLGGEPAFTWWPNMKKLQGGKTGALQDPDPDFDSWEINVSGMVDNPYTITLGELIEQAPSETFISSAQCTINPNSGEMIANVEVTGVPMSWVLEKAGVQAGARSVQVIGTDGYGDTPSSSFYNDINNVYSEGGWLVYEINGERLDNLSGYPVRAWYPDHGVPSSTRWLSDIVVLPDDPAYAEGPGLDTLENVVVYWQGNENDPDNPWMCKPNIAICNTYEGQIIPVGEAYRFEGWADAFNEQVVAIEFSMDMGETWTRFDTSSSDKKAWVYWHFDFTPEEAGAYVLSVRGLTAEGNISTYPDQVMVNAK